MVRQTWESLAVLLTLGTVALLSLAPAAVAQAFAPSFARSDYAAGDGPSSVAVGDFNGDAELDLAVADNGFFVAEDELCLHLVDATSVEAANSSSGTPESCRDRIVEATP